MTVVALDLDQTLIYSTRSAGIVGDLVPLETYEGREISFMTPRAVSLLQSVAEVAEIVPCTTRTRAQFDRVRLPVRVRSAVTANGGIILRDGVPDPHWADAVEKKLADCVPASEVRRRMTVAASWSGEVRIAEDLFCYVVVEREHMPRDWVAALSGWCADAGWTVSVQGRKVYAIPSGLTKSAAVREVAAGRRMLAAGDSLLDADLLLAAEVAVRPAHGELHEQGWTCPGLSITAATGALAGEEILERLLVALAE